MKRKYFDSIFISFPFDFLLCEQHFKFHFNKSGFFVVFVLPSFFRIGYSTFHQETTEK